MKRPKRKRRSNYQAKVIGVVTVECSRTSITIHIATNNALSSWGGEEKARKSRPVTQGESEPDVSQQQAHAEPKATPQGARMEPTPSHRPSTERRGATTTPGRARRPRVNPRARRMEPNDSLVWGWRRGSPPTKTSGWHAWVMRKRTH